MKPNKFLIIIFFRFTAMDSIVPPKRRVVVDFKYFIQSAIEKKLSWNVLTYFLTDLAPTLDKSKEVIELLVQELEKWVLKVEKHSTSQIQAPSENDSKESYHEFQDDLEHQSDLEMPFSDDEKIDEDTSDLTEVDSNNDIAENDPSFDDADVEYQDLNQTVEDENHEKEIQLEENGEVILDKEMPIDVREEELAILNDPKEIVSSDIEEKSTHQNMNMC